MAEDMTQTVIAWEERKRAADAAFAAAQGDFQQAYDQARAGQMSREQYDQAKGRFDEIKSRYAGFIQGYQAFYEEHPDLAKEVHQLQTAALIGAPEPPGPESPAVSRPYQPEPPAEPAREREPLVYRPDEPAAPVDDDEAEDRDDPYEADAPRSLPKLIALAAAGVVVLIVLAVVGMMAFGGGDKPQPKAKPKPKPKIEKPAELDASLVQDVAGNLNLDVAVAQEAKAAQFTSFVFSLSDKAPAKVTDPVFVTITGASKSEVSIGSAATEKDAKETMDGFAKREKTVASQKLDGFDQAEAFHNGRCPILLARRGSRLLLVTTLPVVGPCTGTTVDPKLLLQQNALLEGMSDELS
jgi:hypothetical protein